MVQERERTPEPEPQSESEVESDVESGAEGEVEPEPLYTLKPITYSPILLPTTYSPILAPTTYSPDLASSATHSPLLLPTTYSPNPSPRASPKPSTKPSPKTSPTTSSTKNSHETSFLQPVPEGKIKPSLRKRFSLKKKETDSETLKPPLNLFPAPRIASVAESVADPYLKPNHIVRPWDRSEQRRHIEPLDLSADKAERAREKQIREEQNRERLREERSRENLREERRREERSRERNGEDPTIRNDKSPDHYREGRHKGERKASGALSIPRRPELTTDTPPSRGVDSAYCSESDPPIAIRSINETLPSPSFQSPSSAISAPVFANRDRDHDIPPPILTRDFIPSPRSDKQFFRPVKASPHSPLQRPWTAAPMHHHERVPSSLSRSMAPSRMGMSVMSDMTTVTLEDGKRVKKKRSAFGWLKKAFSLSEEERAEYEERRRRQNPDLYVENRPPRQFLDGKRLPQPQRN